MKKIKLLLALLSISFAFISCDPSDSNGSSQNDDAFAQNFGAVASRDFIGQVVDMDNNPIQNAEIKIGTATVQTDVNGIFIINGASVHEKFAYITAKKAGYFDGSRALVPTSGKNNVKIMLIANNPLQTVQSGVDSEVALPSGTKVNFDGGFQDENGNAYTGSVSVSIFHLTSGDENIDNLMPGMLYAQTATNKEAVLQTFGMLNVELRGSGGQKLNIAEGRTAEITMKIDDSQLATAPNSIPLWHFDDAKGYWKEDGVATKQGNKYVGEVSHFSWWNYDISLPSVRVTADIVDSVGNPLPGLEVVFIANNAVFGGDTDSNGRISGLIPADQSITLTITGSCGPLHTSNVGPFTADTVLPQIVISSSVAQSSVVAGSLLKCNNANVTNGYVLMNYGTDSKFTSVTNGAFSFATLRCNDNNNFTLRGFDSENLQATGTINFSFQANQTNIGALNVCNSVDEFITFTIGNRPQFAIFENFCNEALAFPTVPYFLTANFPSECYHFNSYPNVLLRTASILPGVYTSCDFQSCHTAELTVGGDASVGGPLSNVSVTINNFGAIGEYIDMTFTGNLTNPNGTIEPVHGVIHTKRVE
jgi:hypothetical protein